MIVQSMAHVCHFLTALASRNPSRILTVCQGKKKRAREVLSRIVSLSRALLDKYGLRKGDRVALVARNTDLFFEVRCWCLTSYRWSLTRACIAAAE